jgi:biopolymer transport protein ExbD
MLGLVALAGGVVVLAASAAGSGGLRTLIAVITLSALPGTTAVQMWRVAHSFEPYANDWQWTEDWYLTLPVASEGRFDPSLPPRRIVNLHFGELFVGGRKLQMEDLPNQLTKLGTDRILLRVDHRSPWLHVAWLVRAVRSSGAEQVSVAARRYPGRPERTEDLAALGATWSQGSWPEVEFALPLDFDRGGLRLRIAARERKSRAFGEREVVAFPVSVSYTLGDRTTTDLSELAQWMRESPPALLEPGPDVPFKFVVAVLNALLREKLPLPALVNPRAPSEFHARLDALPWPSD